MKIALTFFFCTTVAFAQQGIPAGQEQAGTRVAAACGSAATTFKVALNPSRHGPVLPEAEKAQIYFIHDAGIPYGDKTEGYPTTKYGVDGSWVGAGHGNSWFTLPVSAGDHHLCAAVQSFSSVVKHEVELVHFTAEPGRSYYFRTRLLSSGTAQLLLEFEPIDRDQGSLLISIFPFAAATPKK